MKTGLGELVLQQTALAKELDVVRFDRVIDRKLGLQNGIMYDQLVNTVRSAIPSSGVLSGITAAGVMRSE